MSDRKIKPQFTSVPFSADSSNGMMHYNGIAKFSPAGIVIEFEARILGLVGNEVKEVQIALEEILDIRFRKGVYKFFSQIQFRLKNFAKVSQLPNQEGKIKLNIKREDFELGRKAVEEILQYMSASNAPLLSSDDETNELSPAPASVNDLFDTEKLEAADSSRETKKLGKNTDKY